MRPSIPPRRSQSQRPLNTATRDLERISDTLTRLYARIEGKLQECRIGEQEASELVSRAERINNRLDVLRVKLRQCYQNTGVEAPGHLQIVLRQMAEVDADDALPELVCPISQCLMIDPVRTCDGQIYDRTSIIEWFATFSDGRPPTSPLTNLPLSTIELTPVLELRQQVQAFIAAKQHAQAVARREEPSKRQLVSNTPAAAASSTGAPPTGPLPSIAASSASGQTGRPIWSSSVVPTHEQNSRELNMLRVSDIELPEGMVSSPLGPPVGGAIRGTPSTRTVVAAGGAGAATRVVPTAVGPQMPQGRVSRPMIRSAPVQAPTPSATRPPAVARIPAALAPMAARAQQSTTRPTLYDMPRDRPASLPPGPGRPSSNLNQRRRT